MTKEDALSLIKLELPCMFLTEMFSNKFINELNLDEEFNAWVSDDDEIVTFNVNTHNLRIVTKGQDGNYSLIRIFTNGGKWATSMDVQEKGIKEVLDRLLEN